MSSVAKKNITGTLVAYMKSAGASKKNVQLATEKMNLAAKNVKKHYSSQQKTEKQKTNWVGLDDVKQFTTAEAAAREAFGTPIRVKNNYKSSK